MKSLVTIEWLAVYLSFLCFRGYFSGFPYWYLQNCQRPG